MIAIWLILFCFSLALFAMSVLDKSGWTFGARVFGMVFSAGLCCTFAYMAWRAH